jgi:hypothetical protein
MLKPNYTVNRGLKTVSDVAEQASYQATDARDRGFFRHMAIVARYLHGQYQGSNEPCAVPLPRVIGREPRDLHAALYEAATGAEQKAPPADAMRLVLAAVLCQLESIDVSINEIRGKGGQVQLVRTITGVGKTDLPPGSTIVFSDAAASVEDYQVILGPGRPVHDITPRGRLERKHPVVQIIPQQDVTRKTGVKRVGEIIHGVLNDIPQQRVGLITHQSLHKKVVKWLGENMLYGEADVSRLTKVSYYGNESRGSNDWYATCDALIIVGTPRVPPSSIRRHLLLLGKRKASRLTAAEACWHPDRWVGRTEKGTAVNVVTGHYRDPDWHAAYLSLVRGELRQAIGRGRSLLPNGIPVYAVTTENLGDICPVADHPYARLTQNQATLLAFLNRCSTKEQPVMTSNVARFLKVSLRRSNEVLNKLLEDGRVKRRGAKGGWYPAAPVGTLP